ncbi:hypothetical protein TNIN_50801 [Trichonephila inaurata madagascariensis]|uniref:Uncharacterized protein n=1 Tax=Trichonephila inaurata madagascariensis TaxID=2747483 RepID=A0A8X6K2C5_9ARAC|nr:hypothetical protein TNIN_50801 [Trichonephila inaurata madagascariensis]
MSRKKKKNVSLKCLSREVLKDMFKEYLSKFAFRLDIFLETREVNDMSLFQWNEDSLYSLNKVLLQAILKKKSYDFKYLRVEDDVLMHELGRALKEVHDDPRIELDEYLTKEIEKFEFIIEQNRNGLKESRNQMQKSSS